jgi:hypothetical protein
MSRSLVQRSLTECGVSECEREASIMTSHGTRATKKKTLLRPINLPYLCRIFGHFLCQIFLFSPSLRVEKGLCADHVCPSVSSALAR